MSSSYLKADPIRASAIISHLSRPGNEGLSNKQAARDLGTNEAYIRRAKAVFGWGETVKLDPNDIKMDGAAQPRATIDQDLVVEYADFITKGAVFPPPDVFYDGTNYWLADGFHRVLAAIYVRRKKIDAKIMSGDRRDAILHSVGVNATHGLRRTNEDKRRAVLALLMDEQWSQWSDRNIAERCKVSHVFVGDVRQSLSGNGFQIDLTRKCERNGKTYEIKTAKINGDRTPEPVVPALPPEPEFTPDEVAYAHDRAGLPAVAEQAHAIPGRQDDERARLVAEIADYWPEMAALLGTPRAARLALPDVRQIAAMVLRPEY